MAKEFLVEIAPNTKAVVIFSSSNAGADPKAWSVQDDILERASDTFAGALEMIRYIGECADEQLAAMKAEGIEVKVGLNLNAKGKFVVAEASAMASIEVKFTIKTAGDASTGQPNG
ncbi:CU044_2847 family protein [Rhizobium sp. RAF56]|uniref:CU044_2847 family protein n=1 Tax=Rhizobium sp. RAF56 TaxID=3233062 RepID=UPI003F96F959